MILKQNQFGEVFDVSHPELYMIEGTTTKVFHDYFNGRRECPQWPLMSGGDAAHKTWSIRCCYCFLFSLIAVTDSMIQHRKTLAVADGVIYSALPDMHGIQTTLCVCAGSATNF